MLTSLLVAESIQAGVQSAGGKAEILQYVPILLSILPL